MTKPSSTMDLRAKILADAAARPSPTRRQWLFGQGLWLLIALLLFAGLASRRGAAPYQERPQVYLWTFSLAFAAVGLLAARALAGFLLTPLGPPRQTVALVRWATVPALALGALLANALAPETLVWPAADLKPHLGCPLVLLASGACVGALALRATRAVDAVTPRSSALTIGAFVGVLALLAVSLQCEFSDPVHVLATHVFPVGLVMAGAVRWGAHTIAGPRSRAEKFER